MVGEARRTRKQSVHDFCWADIDASDDERMDSTSVGRESVQCATLNPHAPEFIPTLSATCPLVAIIVEETQGHGNDGTVQVTFRGCNGSFNSCVGWGDHAVDRMVDQELPAQQDGLIEVRRIATMSRDDACQERANQTIFDGVMPEASEEEWLRRIETRRRAITLAKDTREYRRYISGKLYAERDIDDPMTPNPFDRGISKRSWKYQVQQWRAAFSKISREEGHESSVSTDDWRSASDTVSTIATDDS